MATNFQSLIVPPTVAQQTQSFWLYAAGIRSFDGTKNYIDPTKIKPRSGINQLIQSMIAGDSMLWSSIATMGAQLTDLGASTGQWLDLLAKFYGVTRAGYIATQGTIRVVNSSGTATQFSLTNAASGVVYTSSIGSYPPGTYDLTFTAQTLGPVGDCNLSAITVTGSPNYSVSTTQPVGSFDQAWITTNGQNPENDGQVRQRCYDVIAARSAGTEASIAANIRTATNQSVYRVFVDYNMSALTPIWVAGKNGVSTTSQIALAQAQATKYSQGSANPVVYGASVVPIRFGGTISFPRGVSATYVSGIVQGLADWVNQLPIVTRSTSTMLTMPQIAHQIQVLDSTNQMNYPAVTALCAGSYYQNMSDVIAVAAGSIYSADVTGISIGYT